MKKPALFDPEELLQIATFRIGDETFGLDIMRIKEIVRPLPITHVPRAPFGMIGVAKLRTRVLPVVDVRARFGRHVAEPSSTERLVIITLDGRYIALLVDEVREMVTGRRRDIRLANAALVGDAARFFVGVLSHDDELVLLLNVRRLLGDITKVDLDGLVVDDETAEEARR